MLISEFRGADMCQFVNLSQIGISQEQNCWNDLNYLRFVKQVLQTSTWNHLTTSTGACMRSSAASKISPLCQKSWRAQRGFYERLVVTVHASVAVLKCVNSALPNFLTTGRNSTQLASQAGKISTPVRSASMWRFSSHVFHSYVKTGTFWAIIPEIGRNSTLSCVEFDSEQGETLWDQEENL